MPTVDIRELFRSFQEHLLTKGDLQRHIPHALSRGEATEEGWKEMLASLLPNRYGVTSAIVVDHTGQASDQIDLVIFDPQYTPLLFHQDDKVFVAAESVYAVFEIKQRLDAGCLRYAGDKAASVRSLRRTSTAVYHVDGISTPKPPKPILAGILGYESSWKPALGDAFEAVLADCQDDRRLEIGCALRDGAFYVHNANEEDDAERRVEKSQPRTALAFFWIALLDHLQKLGTVTAIDYGAWRSNLL